jgi:SAM-dependent methyltransferase
MSDAGEGTIDYYDRNAARFAAETGGLDMSPLYCRFLRHLSPGGRILDAGCGVGRDTLAFAERGYSVVAFDASAEMVRLARERAAGRAEVLQMGFEDVAWRGEFDGIWACASLLHVPLAEFPSVGTLLATALRPGGACYMSFKLKTGERIAGDRRFTNHTAESLNAALHGTGFRLADVWTTHDVRVSRAGERWLNTVAVTKAGHPAMIEVGERL